MNKLLEVKWKVEECWSGPECWCGVVVPEEPIIDEDGNEWDVVISAAAVAMDVAKHIVNLHNESLKKNKDE